ncbi:MAG: uroporphyrinogen decarboxylase family protein [Planctomycetota bacterium]|jgi:uroporphyrinogen decarboxylase
MTGRERVAAVLGGEKPDRLPVEVGATEFTGVTAAAYGPLKAGLGVEGGHTRVADPFRGTVRVERAFREKLGVDGVGLFAEPLRWRTGKLPDGSDCLLPVRWQTETAPEGAEVFRHPVSETVLTRRAAEERFVYAEPPLAACETPADVAKALQAVAFFDWPHHADEIASQFGVRAAAKRAETESACVLNVRARLLGGLLELRGARTLADLEENPALVDAILDRLTDTYVARLTDILPEVGPHADVVCVAEGPGEGIGVDAYRGHFKARHERILSHIRKTCDVPVVVFVTGMAPELVREIAELGVDGVGLGCVKRGPLAADVRAACGPDVVIWGAGCASDVLAKGSPDDARDAVKRAVEAAGGPGRLIFAFGEPLGPGTVPENLVAALDAARAMKA